MKPACICALSIAIFVSLPAVAQDSQTSQWSQESGGSAPERGNGPSPFKVGGDPAPSGQTPPSGGTTPSVGLNPPYGGTNPPLGGGTTPSIGPEWRPNYGGLAPSIQPAPSAGGTTPPSGGTNPQADPNWYHDQFEGKVDPETGRIYGPQPGTFIDPPKKQTPETAEKNSSPVNFSFDTLVNYAIIAIGLVLGIRFITKKKTPENTGGTKETT